MTRIRRGGYVFLTWIGDHEPRHVHVLKDDRLVLKWNLEEDEMLDGMASRRLIRMIHELQDEGKL